MSFLLKRGEHLIHDYVVFAAVLCLKICQNGDVHAATNQRAFSWPGVFRSRLPNAPAPAIFRRAFGAQRAFKKAAEPGKSVWRQGFKEILIDERLAGVEVNAPSMEIFEPLAILKHDFRRENAEAICIDSAMLSSVRTSPFRPAKLLRHRRRIGECRSVPSVDSCAW